MPSKKILILSILISLTCHTLVLSLTSFVDMRGSKEMDKVITMDLREDEEKEEDQNPKVQDNSSITPQYKNAEVKNTFQEDTIDLGNEKSDYTPYLKKVKERIQYIWIYPRQAYERGEEGITTIRFSINKNGIMIGSSIMSSSGSTLLDQGVLDLVKSAAPYDPFPPAMNLSKLHIIATFHHKLTE